MKRIAAIAATLAVALSPASSGWAANCCPPPGGAVAQAQTTAATQAAPAPAAPAASQAEPVEMPASGKKIPLPGEGWFTWEFDKKPALGTVVFKVRVFDKTGAQINTLKAVGEVDMPSMRGHHASGPVEFKLNKKNDYLLPVNIVMRGEWEVAIVLSIGDQVVYRGFTRFSV